MHHASYIKEIARGQRGARPLTREQSAGLFDDALNGRMPDAVLGALLVALRMKGETADELLGLADAWYALGEADLRPAASNGLPIVIGSYNGARRQPNLLPLFSLLLQQLGLQVLVHGVTEATGRTTSAEIYRALGLTPAATLADARHSLAATGLAFVPLPVLSPALHRLLAWRELIGVRHLGHSFVKTLNPFKVPALCITGITHPPYRALLRAYFAARRDDALLLRGNEGEAVASLKRLPPVDWCRAGEWQELAGDDSASDVDPCALDAHATAVYTRRALSDARLVPSTLLAQARHVLVASGAVPDPRAAATRIEERLQWAGEPPGP